MRIALLIICVSFLFVAKSQAQMDLTKAVIHHTASPDWSVERIRRIHVEENGWDDCGYHYIIRKDGTVEKGRPLNKRGAHARGRNRYVGIALTGYDRFTDSQRASLTKLLISLEIKHIEPHHENCPGKGLDLRAVKMEIN